MGFLGDVWGTVKEIGTLGPVRRGFQVANQSPGDDAERARKALLNQQAQAAGNFANMGETGYTSLGYEAALERERLRRLAMGQDSMSSEQLRQGLAQQVAAQRSMAAGAAPSMQGMAARTAMMNANRANTAFAGQQALAGIAERQAAAKALSDAITAQRGQDIQVALGSRNTAVQGYGAGNAGEREKAWLEKYGPAAIGGLAGAG